MVKVLIVEDSYMIAAEIEGILRRAGHGVVGLAAYVEDALALAARHRPDVAFVDLQLAGEIDGIEAAMRLVEQYGCAIIVATGSPAAVVESSRIHDLPCTVLHKPFSEQDVLAAMDGCLVDGQAGGKPA